MKEADAPPSVSFKRLRATNSDVSGVGKVNGKVVLIEKFTEIACFYLHLCAATTQIRDVIASCSPVIPLYAGHVHSTDSLLLGLIHSPTQEGTVWLPCLAFHKRRSKTAKVLTAALPLCQASGRQWKEAGQRAGTLKSQNVSSSWNEKMRIKAETKIFRENRAQAIATRKAKLQVRVPLNSCTNAWL